MDPQDASDYLRPAVKRISSRPVDLAIRVFDYHGTPLIAWNMANRCNDYVILGVLFKTRLVHKNMVGPS